MFIGLSFSIAQIMANVSAFLLRDFFTDVLSAGNVNGVAPVPGPGPVRSITDTESKITTTGGGFSIAGGKTSASQGDPRIESGQYDRAAGRIFNVKVNTNATNKDFKAGWRSTLSSNSLMGALAFTSSGAALRFDDNGAGGGTVGLTYAAGTDYQVAIALRAAGAMLFLQGGQYGHYELIDVTETATTTPLIPGVNNFNATVTGGNEIIPIEKYLAAPLASDGFSSWGTTDGLGHAETVDPGNGGSGKPWTQFLGTFGVTSNKAQASALDGATSNAAATVDVGIPDVLVTATLTRSAGRVGVCLRISDTNNFIIVSHDGTNINFTTVLAGTYSSADNAVAFGAGKLRVWCKGTNYNIIWNGVKVGATRSVTNYPLDRMTKFGIYTTDTGNTIDDFCVRAIGTRGEHSRLNTLFGVALPRFVVFDGNSLTAGATPTTSSYPAVCLASLGGGYAGVNFGVYGQTINDMTTDAATQVDPLLNGGRPKNIVVCWEATNSLPNQTAQQCYDNHVAYCQARRSAGWKVIVGTCLPSLLLDADAPSRTKRSDFNTLIRNNWASFADALADMAANTTIGDDGDETNTTYYLSDQTHLTSTGYGVVAGIVTTAIQSIG